MEGATPEEQKAIACQLERVSKRYAVAAKEKGQDAEYLFFTASTAEGPVPRIRSMCGIPSDSATRPVMLILDISDDGAFYMSDEVEINEATVEAFIKAYEAKVVTRQQLKPPQ